MTQEDSMEFEGDKTLYHYTSIYTAIEYIFPFNELRLSPLTSSTDPMEQTIPDLSIGSYGYHEDHERLQKNIDGHGLSKKVNRYYKSLHQLCLCRNEKIDFHGQYTGVFEPIDHFGFAKPRMWHQYGDGYKGICIAISRKKLEEQLTQEFKIIDIEYLKNHLFKPNIDTSGINLNIAEQRGEEKYLKIKCESELKKITKHHDYKYENECKIIVASENDYDFIDIKTCIQGIFVTNKLDYIYKSQLKDIAADYKIPVMEVSIKRTGIKVQPLLNLI